MIPFSRLMFPDVVRVAAVSRAPGKTGGSVETVGTPGPPLPCCWRYGSEGESEAAPVDRTEVVITMSFPSDPGPIKAGDRLIGEAGTARAAGKPKRQDRSGHLWTVKCTAVE